MSFTVYLSSLMSVRRTLATLACVLLAGCALVSCSNVDQIRQDALANSKAVSFTTSDGVQLSGRVFGPSDSVKGLVLAHMATSDQSSWYEFADAEAKQGFRVLTFNFRGYCPGGDNGCSQGTKSPEMSGVDLVAAKELLKSQGVVRLGVIGASIGGTAALYVASLDPDIRAVATLSAPVAAGDLGLSYSDMQSIQGAKLFMAGNGDGTAARDAQTFYQQSLYPKDAEILPSNDHGTALLEGNQSEQVRNGLSGFLSEYVRATWSDSTSP